MTSAGFITPTASQRPAGLLLKFFKHHTGETPGDYRLRASGRG
ncbi:hypothetical protein [Streptomyces sp. NPDC101234]